MTKSIEAFMTRAYVKINGEDPIAIGPNLYKLCTKNELIDCLPDKFDGTIEGLNDYLSRNELFVGGMYFTKSMWSDNYYMHLRTTMNGKTTKINLKDITRVQLGMTYERVELSLSEIMNTFPSEDVLKYMKERLS